MKPHRIAHLGAFRQNTVVLTTSFSQRFTVVAAESGDLTIVGAYI